MDRVRFDYEKSISREGALREMTELWDVRPEAEIVPLDQAFGRVLAEDAVAQFSLPPVRSSRRDGIAVRSADFADGMPDTSTWVRGVDWAQADTGDDFPDAFDAVIAIEQVDRSSDGQTVRFLEDVQMEPGDGVNPCGSIVHEGSVAVPARTRLTPECVAACAVAGLAQVRVMKRPRVGFLATGSELVPWGSYPKRGQNIEANSLMVKGMLAEWGADCIAYPVCADDPAKLERALDRALEACDLVIVNGGSSRGEEDFNSQLLERRGSHFRHGVRAVPGRPVGMAIVDGKPVVNVPGPVMAAWLCMDWLVRGLIAHYYGVPAPKRQVVRARLAEGMKKPEGFERLVRVALSRDEGGAYVASSLPRMGVPQTMFASDGMVTLPADAAEVPTNAEVDVALLRPLEQVGRGF